MGRAVKQLLHTGTSFQKCKRARQTHSANLKAQRWLTVALPTLHTKVWDKILVQGWNRSMGLGAVLGAGKIAFCSTLGAATKAFWCRFRATRKVVWKGAGRVACASPLYNKFDLFISGDLPCTKAYSDQETQFLYYTRKFTICIVIHLRHQRVHPVITVQRVNLTRRVEEDQITGPAPCPIDGSVKETHGGIL